ncbi:hypothetical protein scyTo_0026910, partial [Scyliorhinus torazame]|nr:hypothetical protein [Scyliorhinus torazame]
MMQDGKLREKSHIPEREDDESGDDEGHSKEDEERVASRFPPSVVEHLGRLAAEGNNRRYN